MDGSEDGQTGPTIDQLFHEVESNLYSFESHKAFIEKLRASPGMEELLGNARTTMAGVVALTEGM